ncbi:MAG: ECF transporter S component [Oscillospiraceae bacterium]|nr:ECF transporter S component [Oscillospiraceae bacterium]
MKNQKQIILKTVLSGLFLALCIVLPFITVNAPQLGSILLLMHIPVLLCGFVCGAPYGLAVGFIAPLLRSLLFQGPPMVPPMAPVMAFELAAYGFFCGLLYKLIKIKKPYNIYISLPASMLIGRAVWGVAMYFAANVFAGFKDAFTLTAFIAGAFGTALPGIIIQLAIIPFLVVALETVIKKSGFKAQ